MPTGSRSAAGKGASSDQPPSWPSPQLLRSAELGSAAAQYDAGRVFFDLLKAAEDGGGEGGKVGKARALEYRAQAGPYSTPLSQLNLTTYAVVELCTLCACDHYTYPSQLLKLS